LIGGTLHIESAPGQGTTLNVQLPLEQARVPPSAPPLGGHDVSGA